MELENFIGYPDSYIERWGRVFCANPEFMDYGVTFEQFLKRPEKMLHVIGIFEHIIADDRNAAQSEINSFLPLLPEQVDVMKRLMHEEQRQYDAHLQEELDTRPDVVMRNGSYIEPLRHHAYPNSNRQRRVVQ